MSGARFVTFEGIEGAGKSTVVRIAHDWLAARGVPVCLTREPGGTPLAERVRDLVLHREEEAISPVAETLLMFAARAIHVENLIRPALARGEWVLCDRFTDATRAYQGGGRGVSLDLIDRLAEAVQGGLVPHRTFLLDLDPREGLERSRRRGAAPDRFEKEQERFFERVRAAYLELARREPARIRVLDAAQPLEVVRERLIAELDKILEESGARP